MRFGGTIKTLTAASLAAVIGSPQLIAAYGDLRQLSFYNIHTKETTRVLFKKDGKYIASGLKQANWIFRDWRQGEPTKMDPKLLDLLWDMHQELGSKKPIHIISGFRSLKTNNMLRRTVGGQAKKSQHILGKAADVYFPDIPLKKLRYSALVREMGGVGYYPTSGTPFVHIDTGRVRHWPRLPRYELALLFPGGSSRHRPSGGGPLTRKDVRIAQRRHQTLAVKIASFHQFRKSGKGRVLLAAADQPAARSRARATRVASLAPNLPPTLARAPRLARRAPRPVAARRAPRPAGAARTPGVTRSASLAPAPRLARSPRPARRSWAAATTTRRNPGPSKSERNALTRLALAATALPEPRLEQPPKAAVRPVPRNAGAGNSRLVNPRLVNPRLAHPRLAHPRLAHPRLANARLASLQGGIARAAFDQFRGTAGGNETNAMIETPLRQAGWGNGWVVAPAFDDDHPEELSYRPFPIAPLLTSSASSDDPVLSGLTHHDAAKTLELLGGIDAVPAMRFRPKAQVARLLWSHQFEGKAVNLDSLYNRAAGVTADAGLNNRQVTTTRGG